MMSNLLLAFNAADYEHAEDMDNGKGNGITTTMSE